MIKGHLSDWDRLAIVISGLWIVAICLLISAFASDSYRLAMNRCAVLAARPVNQASIPWGYNVDPRTLRLAAQQAMTEACQHGAWDGAVHFATMMATVLLIAPVVGFWILRASGKWVAAGFRTNRK